MDLCHFWHFSALLMTDVFQNDLGRSLGYFLSWPGYEGAEHLAAETQRMNQNFRKLETWLEHCHHMTHTRILQRFSNNQIIFIGPRSKISWVHTSLLSQQASHHHLRIIKHSLSDEPLWCSMVQAGEINGNYSTLPFFTIFHLW